MFGNPLDLAAKDITEPEKRAGPKERASAVEQQKALRAHVEDAGQRRRDGAQPGKKFCYQKGTRALCGKDTFGAAHARIRLQRNLTEQLKDFDALDAAQRIPNGIRGYRRKNTQK